MNVRSILSDPDYPALKDYVLTHTGLAYYADRDEDFATRLSRRITAVRASGCAAYLSLLRKVLPAPPEIDALVGELTIGETYFFRQREHFDLLRSTIIPDLVERNRESRRLRFWSAGCATGAEPYSLAMLLQLDFPELMDDWDISILGTDINMDFLEQARTGRFTNWALRDVPASIQQCCFIRDGNRWVLNKELRRGVIFRYHNLAEDAGSPSQDGIPFDLILCRNVMIYFSAERIRSVAEQFSRLLTEGGWLLVGHAEMNAEAFPQFELYRDENVTAYRKPGAGQMPGGREPWMWQPLPVQEFPYTEPVAPAVAAEAAVGAEAAPVPVPAAEAETVEDARMVADRGGWTAAEAICRRLIAANPLNAPAHFMLGMVLSHTDSSEGAAEELRRAIYSDRKFVLAYYYLGTLLQALGDLPAARKAFRNTMNLLQDRFGDEPLEHGDGITVEELKELVVMHQGILGE